MSVEAVGVSTEVESDAARIVQTLHPGWKTFRPGLLKIKSLGMSSIFPTLVKNILAHMTRVSIFALLQNGPVQ